MIAQAIAGTAGVLLFASIVAGITTLGAVSKRVERMAFRVAVPLFASSMVLFIAAIWVNLL